LGREKGEKKKRKKRKKVPANKSICSKKMRMENRKKEEKKKGKERDKGKGTLASKSVPHIVHGLALSLATACNVLSNRWVISWQPRRRTYLA